MSPKKNPKKNEKKNEALEAAAMAVNDTLDELADGVGVGPDEILEAVQQLRDADRPDRAGGKNTAEQQARTPSDGDGDGALENLARVLGISETDGEQDTNWPNSDWKDK